MDNLNKNVLDDDRIVFLLIKLSLPAFMGMFVMSLYNVVDTIFIGRYVGPLAIASLAIVFPVQMLAMGVGMITGMGGSSLISRLIGAGNISRAERTLGNANAITIGLSLLLMIVGLSNIDSWLRMMGASEAILPAAREYLTIILIGMFFQTFAMSQNNLIRAEGNANVPMIGMIIGAGLNIILDAVFIIPLHMGVRGAAWATVISQIISSIYFILYFLTGKSYLKIHVKNLILDWSIVKGIMAIGVSAFAMTVAGSISGVLMNRVLGAFGGDLAISAFGILNRLMMFATMPSMVIGQGLQPILGFNYGAGRYRQALRSIKIATTIATVLSLASFIAVSLFPQYLIGIFTTDSELISLSTDASRIIFVTMLLMGFIMVGETIFMATGKAIEAFITSLSRPALFLIPLIFILPHFWQITGVWLAFPAADALTFILIIILLIPLIGIFRKQEPSSELQPKDLQNYGAPPFERQKSELSWDNN